MILKNVKIKGLGTGILLSTLGIFSITEQANAQLTTQNLNGRESSVNAITTAVPFLLIGPDSRAGAMGDGGVATSPDVYSSHWNSAKYAFMEKKYAFGLAYTPWLQALVPDINLAYLSGYYKIDKKQTIGGSLRFFSLGDITFTDMTGNVTGSGNPNELSIDFSYNRKLSDKFAIGTAFRFINSDLAQGQLAQNGQSVKAGRSVAVDISGFYTNPDFIINGKKTTIAYGFDASNIGAKMNYTNSSDRYFIPTNLRVGASGTMKLDNFNEIMVFVEANKLLVPTNPIYAVDSTNKVILDSNGDPVIVKGQTTNVSVPRGIFQSFNDAPGGLTEEFHEIYYSAGFEYWYDKQFALRAGYFYEHPTKGNRQYFTFGAGIKYNIFGLDLSYLVPTTQRNPLENTLRFSLTFNFESPEVKN
jgi:hypothetical protein